jgi:hypothetical protein
MSEQLEFEFMLKCKNRYCNRKKMIILNLCEQCLLDEADKCYKEKYVPFFKKDNVNHPPHYTNHPSGIECIEITRHMGFNLGNAIKYIWRADLKENTMEDLEKARWYINDEIRRRKDVKK